MNTNIFKTTIAALALLVAFNSCKKEETKFHIEVTCNPEHGTVAGTGDYAEGSKATIIATPNEGYFFAKWEGYSSTDSIITVNVSADKTYTAIFGKADIIEKFQNGYKKTSETIEGYTITYEAVPDENCYFLKWSNGNINSVITTHTAETDLTPIFRQYPEGSIHALFFVSPTKRVIFSKGNLQFNPSLGTHTRADGTTAPGTWRFAESQTECIKDDTKEISATYNGWMDYFAWGTSGWSGSGATYYQPYDGYISEWFVDDEDEVAFDRESVGKLFGPQGGFDLTGEYAYADWGVYNPISNGGNKPGMWRTLSCDEFNYFVLNNTMRRYDYLYWFFNEESNSKFDKEYYNVDDVIKEIGDNNNVVFFYNFIIKGEYWSATSTPNNDNSAIVSNVFSSLEKIDFDCFRCFRSPVRLVMDVEE